MKTIIIGTVLALSSVLTGACASAPPKTASSSSEATDAQATRPDATLAKKHLENHVQYPATRSQILAACANTPEFTAGEKRWLEQSLPDGTYQTSSEVISALKL